ncbi:MAG TPA: hypothetical protein VMW08_00910 [Acidimicrobiales bacterium]|nr:hypothetical protein [Acidimicrobiales bacterium]
MDIELLDRYQRATGFMGVGDPFNAGFDQVDRLLDSGRGRREACIEFSWSVPTLEAVMALVACGPIIDPMAGTGYWAMLVDQAGGDVIASDVILPGDDPEEAAEITSSLCGYGNPWHAEGGRQWFPIGRQDARQAASDHPERTLVLSWPPYGDEIGAAVEEAFWTAGGKRMVYIGEPGEGCTGDEVLHARLGWSPLCRVHEFDFDPDEYECVCELAGAQRWLQVSEVSLPQWFGMHDALFIFDRKDPA